MATIVTAPEEDYTVATEVYNTKLFLAGGITNCPDWQSELIELIKDFNNLTIFNPRRTSYPMDKPEEAQRQIVWEYKHLKESDLLVFWFARGSLNPIVLYEYGLWAMATDIPLVVGVDPEYERLMDVVTQTMLARPEVGKRIRSSMSFVFSDIEDMLYAKKKR